MHRHAFIDKKLNQICLPSASICIDPTFPLVPCYPPRKKQPLIFKMQYIVDIMNDINYSMQCGGEEREKQENQNCPN